MTSTNLVEMGEETCRLCRKHNLWGNDEDLMSYIRFHFVFFNKKAAVEEYKRVSSSLLILKWNNILEMAKYFTILLTLLRLDTFINELIHF